MYDQKREGVTTMIGGGSYNNQSKRLPGAYMNLVSAESKITFLESESSTIPSPDIEDLKNEIADARGGEESLNARLNKMDDVRQEVIDSRSGEENLSARLDKIVGLIPEIPDIPIQREISTENQAKSGVDDTTIMTPAKVKIAIDQSGGGGTTGSGMAMCDFINPKEIALDSTKKEIISITFGSETDTSAEFKAAILLNITAANETDKVSVKVSYIRNGNTITSFCPEETYTGSGKHAISLYYPMADLLAGGDNVFKVEMLVTNCTAVIGQFGIMAAIIGTGLDFEKVIFDGTLKFAEEMPVIQLGGMEVKPFVDMVGTSTSVPVTNNIAEQFGRITMGGMTIKGFEAVLGAHIAIKQNTLDITDEEQFTYSTHFVDVSENYKLQRHYVFTPEEQEIDVGRTCITNINTGQFKTVEGIEVTLR